MKLQEIVRVNEKLEMMLSQLIEADIALVIYKERVGYRDRFMVIFDITDKIGASFVSIAFQKSELSRCFGHLVSNQTPEISGKLEERLARADLNMSRLQDTIREIEAGVTDLERRRSR